MSKKCRGGGESERNNTIRKIGLKEEIENRNRSVTSTEVESVIKNPQGKVQDQMASRVYCTKHLEKS